jgi:chlorite dismutase
MALKPITKLSCNLNVVSMVNVSMKSIFILMSAFLLVSCNYMKKNKQQIAEELLSIPDYPKKVQRYSDIKFTMHTNFVDKRTEVVDSIRNFGFDVSQHWHIKDDNLVVIDSLGDKNHLELYLIRQQGFSLFAAYATLNDIAYNVLSLNFAHTAYYVRGSYDETAEEAWVELYTSLVHNKHKLHIPANSGVRIKKWTAFSIEDIGRLSPAVTKYPCYIYGEMEKCYKLNAQDHGMSNIDYSHPITLQPIATVGYKNFDWMNYSFKHPLLVQVNDKYAGPRNEEVYAAAEAETEQVLSDIPSTVMDIGWYGFPKEKRDKIMRYQITRLYFELKHDKNLKADEVFIPQNGIQARHFNAEDATPPFKSINNKEIFLKEKVKYNAISPSEEAPPKT